MEEGEIATLRHLITLFPILIKISAHPEEMELRHLKEGQKLNHIFLLKAVLDIVAGVLLKKNVF